MAKIKYKLLVVATEAELELPEAKRALEYGYKAVITGVGPTNVIRALKDIPDRRHVSVLNVGYCGSISEDRPIGHVCYIGFIWPNHPNLDKKCGGVEEALLSTSNGGDTTCITSSDFITSKDQLGYYDRDAVVDMELAYIAAFDWGELDAVKYVSDHLNYKQYEQCLKK